MLKYELFGPCIDSLHKIILFLLNLVTHPVLHIVCAYWKESLPS